jgi:hypothetical protein
MIPTDLDFRHTRTHHVLKQALQDGFQFEQEGGTVASLSVSSEPVLEGVAASSTCQRIERVQTRHLELRLQRFVRTVQHGYHLHIVLSKGGRKFLQLVRKDGTNDKGKNELGLVPGDLS